jgi:hypothetical protein
MIKAHRLRLRVIVPGMVVIGAAGTWVTIISSIMAAMILIPVAAEVGAVMQQVTEEGAVTEMEAVANEEIVRGSVSWKFQELRCGLIYPDPPME